MTEDAAHLFETVIAAMTEAARAPAAEPDPIALIAARAPQARVLATLRALLLAEAALRTTFARADAGPVEADLARSAALRLAESADAQERRDPDRAGLRLAAVFG
jgi:hypothetical protein